MRFTKTQQEAIDGVVEWYYSSSHEKNLFVIGGYAGTGKTTIVKHIISLLGLAKYNVLFAAYTGKAASVLRIKGNLAHTIHKTFYTIFRINGAIRFKLKKKIPSIIKLIVLDEIGMINTKMIDDVCSFGVPVIGLGDPGQLPPIYGKNIYIDDADSFLIDVMRQDDKSGILTLSTMARNGERLIPGKYGDSKVLPYFAKPKYTEYDVILCWRNSTRRHLNARIRKELGRTSVYPERDEKIICLKNNYVHKLDYDDIPIFLVNGLNIVSVDDGEDVFENNNFFYMKYKPDFIERPNLFFETKCDKWLFDKYILEENSSLGHKKSKNDKEDDNEDPTGDIVTLDYGYALTVHKSQGSEWGNVLVIDEYQGSKEQYNQWLYTAITRAQKSVTIVKI